MKSYRRRKASFKFAVPGGAKVRRVLVLFVFIFIMAIQSFFAESVLFVYKGDMKSNLWNLSHELGQIYFSKAFPTVNVEDMEISEESTGDFMRQIGDYDLVFITDPSLERYLDNLPEPSLSKIWVCNGEKYRGYFIKDYEATFLLGVAAGLYTGGQKKIAVLIDSIDNEMYFRMVNALLLGMREAGYNDDVEVLKVCNKDFDELFLKLKDCTAVVNLSTNSKLVKKLEEWKIDNFGFYIDQSINGKFHNLVDVVLNWGAVYSRIYMNEVRGIKMSNKCYGFEDKALLFSPFNFRIDRKIFNILDYFKKKLISNEYRIFKEELLDTNNQKIQIDFSQDRQIFKMNKFLKGVVIE